MALENKYSGKATDASASGAEVLVSGTTILATPSTSGYVLDTVPAGASVGVKYNDGSWALCYYAGVTGYIRSSQLLFGTTTVEEFIDQPGPGESYAVVASSAASLNMRSMPSLNAELLMEIAKGETVIVASYGSEWCQVRYNGISGYCMTKYLKISSQDTSAALTAVVTTASGGLNLRKSASTNATILMAIPRNSTVTVLNKGAEWSYVTYGDKTGYVMNTYLTFSGTVAPTTIPNVQVTPTPIAVVPTPTPSYTAPYAVVTTASGSLNLRKSASSDATILAKIPRLATIKVLGIYGTWTQVSYNGTVGYVMSVFLTYVYTEPEVTAAPVTAAPTAATTYYTYARVTTASGGLNLRSSASTSGKVKAVIPQNTVISVISMGGTWTQVSYNNMTGYVMNSFLTFISVEGTTAPTASPSAAATAKVTTKQGALNLRQSASSSAKVLTTIPQNTIVNVLSRGDTWSQVTYLSHTGWVMSSFLTFDAVIGENVSIGPSETSARVTTKQGSLNLRNAPSTSASIRTTIPQNMVIEVLEKGAVWTKVIYSGIEGYVKTEFLTFISTVTSTPAPSVPSVPSAMGNDFVTYGVVRVGIVTANGTTNLYSSTDASAINAVLMSSEYVQVTAENNIWYRISYNGTEGYAAKTAITLK